MTNILISFHTRWTTGRKGKGPHGTNGRPPWTYKTYKIMKNTCKNKRILEIAERKLRVFANPGPALISVIMESNTKWE